MSKIRAVVIFIYVISIVRFWYNFVLFPMVLNPTYYIVVGLWTAVVMCVTYLFSYRIGPFRMRYVHKKLCESIVLSAVSGIVATSIGIGLYQAANYYTVTSAFFKHQRAIARQFFVFMPGSALTSILEQRIITVIFLCLSTIFSLYFVSEVLYQLKEKKAWYVYVGLASGVSIICYIMYMLLGMV